MERKNYVTWLGSFIICWFLPVFCFAEFWITEIHFNPPGSDSGFEWIEVQNRGSGTESIEKFTFRENEINHGLKIYQGDFILDKNEYVVIADKPEKFVIAFPDYQGTIIDSAFSLNNTGEKLELLDPDKNIVFEVTYSADTAPGDDGSSIGLISDIWQAVVASPGTENQTFIIATEATDEKEGSLTETKQNESNTETKDQETTKTSEPNNFSPDTYIRLKDPDYRQELISVQSGGDRTVMAGADYEFTGQVFGLTGEPLDDPQVYWNWGDGNTSEGITALHHYLYPGTYTAVMRANLRDHYAREHFTVTVIEPSIHISHANSSDNILHIENKSGYTLELSGYVVRVDDHVVTLADDTFISGNGSIILSGSDHGFNINTNSIITLGFDKKSKLVRYDVKQKTKESLQSQINQIKEQALSIQNKESTDDTNIDKVLTPETVGVTRATVYTNIAAVTEPADLSVAPDDATIPNNKKESLTFYPNQQANISNSFSSQNSPFFTLQLILITLILGAAGVIAYLHNIRERKELTEAEKEAEKINIL